MTQIAFIGLGHMGLPMALSLIHIQMCIRDRRRRAIYTGLAGHCSYEEVWPLLALWESKYAEQPPFALNEFLAEVVLLALIHI